jgi:Arc/MetJ-type ribon-helix-helix transcriptional regulator
LKTLVESGRYQNASEVLRDVLRLVEQHGRFREYFAWTDWPATRVGTLVAR